MRRLFFCLAVVASAAGCGSKPTPDAGPMIDTSCGIDCAAQGRYGLLKGTCFEYSDTSSIASPPSLAAEVMEAIENFEGSNTVIQVRYTSGGQRRQQDTFTILNGELRLVRREFGAGGTSVSYKNAAGDLEGVKWLAVNTGIGENISMMSSADVITPGSRVTEATTYRVTTSAAGTADLNVPYTSFDGGVRMLITESPMDHGSDTRRVWVPDVGFAMITTPLMLSGGASQEYKLQNIKNTADGGICGF